ncbi:zn2 cys6 dna-binding [Trichoderma arundinaceum]|uniref:Zn2 cys6 dna-binding n=1 Tax=Trichoderma arundinaceum TaxID=490622 RepID=A0A395NYN6_TRIAR|nr:zn2 cys6 dna-binding [Trichoderma arundinaceum]
MQDGVWKSQDHAGFDREYIAKREIRREILKMNMAEVDDIEDEVSVADEDFGLSNATKKRKTSAKDEGPACQLCRRKKARCSRQQPCDQCLKYHFECVYDERKAKPGVRMGAIEHLTQRVTTLENMFLGQGVLWQQVWKCLDTLGIQQPLSESGYLPGHGLDSEESSLREHTYKLRDALSLLANQARDDPSAYERPSPKRRRIQEEQPKVQRGDLGEFSHDVELPPDDLIDALVEIYFARIHPWIPMLHVREFREKMAIPSKRQRLTTIFHAIVSLCVRFSHDPRLDEPEIGSGRGPSAWSIVGSMARTAEQLQLSIEDEESHSPSGALIKRIAFLPPCKSWKEVEERRRIFWNVFLMDRFCSIATGWNCSLTSVDVKRRLPCEGALWEEGEPLKTPTPYFGIADQSANAAGTLLTARPEDEDPSSLGGFAYCIEATESLSLVTTFFLQQAVDVSKMRDVQLWLMKFKQLDLRLVQWKVFLPERWREACVLNDGIMDPNLTLAHITHNTAVVLLHQGIAYPSTEWQATTIRLPSASSAETCLAAATEVAIIADKFLQCSPILTNPQFAFCLFICGRMLLAHAIHYSCPLAPEFESLISSLGEVSRRCNGPHTTTSAPDNLASKFAVRLDQARQHGAEPLDIREAAYSQGNSAKASSSAICQQGFSDDGPGIQSAHLGIPVGTKPANASINPDQEGSPDSISLAFPPLPLAFQPQLDSAAQTRISSPMPITSSLADPSSVFAIPSAAYDNPGPPIMDAVAGPGFEQLNSYLEYSFLPNQRISMFSQHDGKGQAMS